MTHSQYSKAFCVWPAGNGRAGIRPIQGQTRRAFFVRAFLVSRESQNNPSAAICCYLHRAAPPSKSPGGRRFFNCQRYATAPGSQGAAGTLKQQSGNHERITIRLVLPRKG
jgi:hypothetical protein